MAATAQRCAMAVIEYDGTAFAGSQVQPTGRTVQGELEEALNRLTGERVRARLAGRTDAGVHATGQVAVFCLPARTRAAGWGWPELRRRLNAVLPADLGVRTLQPATAGFDPRRDALRRIYRYRIRMAGESRALERHRTLEIDDRLDVAAMQAAAQRLTGERDFSALGSHPRSTVRNLAEVRVTQRGTLVEVRVTADAFLRRMVRSIVAVLLAVGRGRLAPEGVDGILDAGRRALDGRAAPARGLTLERVLYPSSHGRITKHRAASARQQRTPESRT